MEGDDGSADSVSWIIFPSVFWTTRARFNSRAKA